MLIGPLRDLLTRCHAFRSLMRFPVILVEAVIFLTPMRFPYEISRFLVGYVSNETFLVRFNAFQLHTYLMTLHAFGLFRYFHMRISYMLFEA
jgi:hypothetical protein